MDDLLWLDACAQKELLDKGELSSRELVEATIQRIDDLNPGINAVIHRSFEKAIDTARSSLAGPFAGIPILIKDAICHTAGDPMHEGMRFLKDRNWVEDSDSYLAQRLRRAGFVIVGKTNLPELALAPTTEPVAYGATRNPWDLDRSTGGSSGGAAAAVAAGMVAVAHANDWAGSIRIPASACGVVGLKPSRGRVSAGPRFAEIAGGRGAEHVITRSVRDSAAVLDAIAGPQPGDPYAAASIEGTFASHLGSDDTLRIGIFTAGEVDGTPIHDDCTKAVRTAGAALESMGHSVEESWPQQLESGMAGHLASIYGAYAARMLDMWSQRVGQEITEEDVEAETWAWAEAGRGASAPRFLADKEWLDAWGRKLGLWWRNADVLVTPTLVDLPPKLGELETDPEDPWSTIVAQGRFGLLTAPWNVSGQPAVSLPLQVSNGLPIGVQLIAAPGREDVLISIAAQLEQGLPWRERRPLPIT